LWSAGLLTLVFVGIVLVTAEPTLAMSPLMTWANPVRADDQLPFASPAAVTGVSCPSTGLCVAVDSVGNVLTSTGPTGGTGAWVRTYTGEDSTGVESFTDISCPSTKLCVAVDSAGNIVTSTDPAGSGSTWTKTEVVPYDAEGESDRLEAVSCPSSGLCVVVDGRGDVLTSTAPTDGAGTWTTSKVAAHGLRGVSCPSTKLCVAVNGEGVFASTDPTGGRGAWTETNVDGTHELLDVSCVSESLCVASDNYGDILTATEPTGDKTAWATASVDNRGLIEHVSCVSWGLCLALDGREVIASMEPAGGASTWVPASIDTSNMYASNPSLDAAACPSADLCVLGDEGGAVVTSTEPTEGASAWTVSDLEVGSSGLRSVSCAPVGLCVAVDDAGNIVTSTDPAGGAGAWSEAHVDNHEIDGVSCPLAGLCVAVDNAGDILTSTDPTGGAGAWSIADVGRSRPLESVSCPSQNMCVATANEGYVVTSTDPTGGVGAWSLTKITEGFLRGISCPSVDLCVAAYGGEIVTSTEPSIPKASVWTIAALGHSRIDDVSCPSEELCLAVDIGDGVLVSTDPKGGADTWSDTYIEGLNGLASMSCEVGDLCVATAFAGNGSKGNVIASTDFAGGTGSWVKSNVYALPVVPPFAPVELYIEDLTGVSCASGLCVVIDTQGDVIVGTRSATAPVNSSLPVASGTPVLGQTLSCSSGLWASYPPPVFAYQWLRDGTPINRASTNTYVVQTADEGHGLACQITASNIAGAESVTSNTLQVSAAPTSGSGGSDGSSGGSGNPGTLTGTMRSTFVLNSVECVAAHGTVKLMLTLPGPGMLRIVGRATPTQLAGVSHAKGRKTMFVIARRWLMVSKAGRILVTVVPTAGAKAILVRRGKLRATITITYTPKGSTPRSIVRAVTFRLKRQR
jgi:hypothetical protein